MKSFLDKRNKIMPKKTRRQTQYRRQKNCNYRQRQNRPNDGMFN